MVDKNSRPAKRPKLDPPDQAHYEVGYAKPPKGTRFKPGESGNPAGRPRGAKNKRPALNEERLQSIVLDEAYRSISVNDGDLRMTVPMAQAIVRSIAVNAAKGNHRAQKLFTDLLSSTETARKRLHDEWLEVVVEYKINWERELRRRQLTGDTGPEPIPHPDHITVDLDTGLVRITGPMTEEEKERWEYFEGRKAVFEQSIEDTIAILDAEPDQACRKEMLDDIKQDQRVLEIIESITAGRTFG